MRAARDISGKTFLIAIIIIGIVFAALFAVTGGKKGAVAAQKDAVAALKAPFTANAVIRLNGFTLNADISKTAVGAATITVSEPAALKNMQFQYDGRDITASYLGMSVKLNQNSKLAGSLIKLIVDSIDKAAGKSGVSIKQNGDTLIITGDSNGTEFSVALDAKSGAVASISLPTLDASCEFDSFLSLPKD